MLKHYCSMNLTDCPSCFYSAYHHMLCICINAIHLTPVHCPYCSKFVIKLTVVGFCHVWLHIITSHLVVTKDFELNCFPSLIRSIFKKINRKNNETQ